MTAQRPSPLFGSQARAQGTRLPHRFNVAVSTAAIPAVLLSSVALAQPAAAAPAPVNIQHAPRLAPAVTAPTAPSISAANVPIRIPSWVAPAQKAPTTYTVQASDTISGIALRHGLETDAVLQLNGISASTVIHPGQKIKLSGSPSAEKSSPDEKSSPASTASYTVKAGDTLSVIATRHGVSLGSVLSGNNLSMNSIIQPGQKIKLADQPSNDSAAPTPAPESDAAEPAPNKAKTYTVRSGDTLSGIAASHGVSLGTVLSANGLSMSSMIHLGQKIKLGGESSVSVQTTGITPTAPEKDETVPTDLVPSTFLHYTYPQHVVSEANRNKHLLNGLPVPDNNQMRTIVAETARSMGVDPSLALAVSYQESGFNQRAVSPANAIGAMQVIPTSGEWASDLVGRQLNLLDPQDNATAGVAILRSLIRTSPNLDDAVASYYQGQYSVTTHGMFADTENYVAAIKAHQVNYR